MREKASSSYDDQSEKSFNFYCRSKSVESESLISKHLRSIFRVGKIEGRLDISELLSHTTHELFKWNNLLRSVLSIFIVIGLLGTLFGLADSLDAISKIMDLSKQQGTNEGISESLSKFIGPLRSAFAPSILGVSFTILGILIYSVYTRFVCIPAKSMLEQLTLTVWVPKLYQTTSQKMEEQMTKGFETAIEVNKLVTSVQSGVGAFDHNIKEANKALGPLADAAGGINKAADAIDREFAQKLGKFTEKFEVNVSKLTSFQGELTTLYKQMVDSPDKLYNSMSSQNDELKTVVNALKLYESNYIEERGKIDTKLQKFIEEATQTTGSLSDKNRELMEKINTQMTGKLVEIAQRFDRFDVPLSDAAKKIGTTHDNLDRSMREIVGGLQQEYEKQNANNKQQIETLNEVNKRIEQLLIQLTENNKAQSKEVLTLSAGVETLNAGVKTMSSSIAPLTTHTDSLASGVSSMHKDINLLNNNVSNLSKAVQNQTTITKSKRTTWPWPFGRKS